MKDRDARARARHGGVRSGPRAGLGRNLLDRSIEFLEGLGCATLELSVTETNHGAIALYESRRFRYTGHSQPLRPGSELANRYMRREP